MGNAQIPVLLFDLIEVVAGDTGDMTGGATMRGTGVFSTEIPKSEDGVRNSF